MKRIIAALFVMAALANSAFAEISTNITGAIEGAAQDVADWAPDVLTIGLVVFGLLLAVKVGKKVVMRSV